MTAEATPTFIEQALVEIWSDLLKRPIRLHDNFFSAGGDSLSVTTVTFRVEELIGAYVAPVELFEHPVLCDFAARIDLLRGSWGSTGGAEGVI